MTLSPSGNGGNPEASRTSLIFTIPLDPTLSIASARSRILIVLSPVSSIVLSEEYPDYFNNMLIYPSEILVAIGITSDSIARTRF